ncbi:hypothetical protein FACS1894196_0410 [Clostridia bacterium]|nr:hypothetical protein FACS1894196_0410 [Clostridia bacterium]
MTEIIVSEHKDLQNRLQGFDFAEETATFAAQTDNVVAQIGIASFYVVGVTLVAHISYVFADKVHAQIALSAICVIFFCLKGAVYHFLYTGGVG